MASTITISTTFKDGASTTSFKSHTVAGDLLQDIDTILPVGANEVEFDVVIPFGKILAIGIGAAKAVTVPPQASNATYDMTVKTNSATAPSQTFANITPSNGVAWSKGDPVPLPVTADITKLFVTNNGTGVVELLLQALLDATPTLP